MEQLEGFLKETMQLIPPWAYVALTGFVVAGGQRIRNFLASLTQYVWAEATIPEKAMGLYLANRFKEGIRPSRWRPQYYDIRKLSLKNQNSETDIGIIELGEVTLWIRWKGLRVPINLQENGNFGYNVKYIRGTFDPARIVQDAVKYWNALGSTLTQNRYRVGMISGSMLKQENEVKDKSPNQRSNSSDITENFLTCVPMLDDLTLLGTNRKLRSLSTMALEDPLLHAKQDMLSWHQNKDWYQERGLSWKRGYLLHGKPGVGKTSLIRAIGKELDLPVFLYNLNSMTDSYFQTSWSQLLTQTPCIIAIEDIDAVYRGRTPCNPNPLQSYPPSFETILNCIDGVRESEGLLVFLTTNNLENVDTALGGLRNPDGSVAEQPSLRPGRIDRVVRFPDTLTEDKRRQLADRIMAGYEEAKERVIVEGAPDTPAQFQERCVRTVLAVREGLQPDLESL